MIQLPAQMTVIGISKPGGPEVLVPEQRSLPVAGGAEILIKVAASGVNRPDAMQRSGSYPPPPGASDIPGLEVAGEVVAVGANVTRWKIGDRVMALVAGGGYAEYCITHESHALPVPESLSWVQAAAIPETFFTVWHNLFERGRLTFGQTALIHGGSSGIGTTAIQLASALGAQVFATAGSQEKCEACVRLGARVAINYKTQDFVAEVARLTDGAGVDVILDMIGGDYVQRNLQAAAVEGHVVQIAAQHGARVALDIMFLMKKRLTLTGSTLRPRSIEEKAAIARGVQQHAMPLVAAGRISPVIDSIFPMREASLAHARLESSAHIGKIVLQV